MDELTNLFLPDVEPEDVYGTDEFAAFEDDEYDQREFVAQVGAYGPTHGYEYDTDAYGYEED